MLRPSVSGLVWIAVALLGSALLPAPARAQADQYPATAEAHRQIGLDWLHSRGYRGRGVRIAVFDSGFLGVNATSPYRHVFDQGRLLVAADVFDPGTDPYDDDAHGSGVLSVLAGIVPALFMGGAPEATYLLYRTENAPAETRAEEIAWAHALDSAIARRAHVVVSSLGYSRFDPGQGDYTPADMDGRTATVTQAANRAAPADIVVVNSAGNEGLTSWRSITAPCDAPELLCVGAVDQFNAAGPFSSYGPSADGRVKPDVAARGVAASYLLPDGSLSLGQGTSFAAPLVGALVACLRQAHPSASAAQIIAAVRQSTATYPASDAQRGYGLPNARRADALLRQWLGLPPLESTQLLLYPNPAQRVLRVQLSTTDATEPITLRGVDLAGRQLFQVSAVTNAEFVLDLPPLAPGLYLLCATWSGGHTCTRFQVIHN